jgi:hypothetical protein
MEESEEPSHNAEDKFEEALQLLLRSGKIKGYIRARPNGELDVQGIDFLIFPKGTSLLFAAQVKTKRRRCDFKAALARHLLIHPLVQEVFGIEPRHKPQHIALRIIKRICKRLRMICIKHKHYNKN